MKPKGKVPAPNDVPKAKAVAKAKGKKK